MTYQAGLVLNNALGTFRYEIWDMRYEAGVELNIALGTFRYGV